LETNNNNKRKKNETKRKKKGAKKLIEKQNIKIPRLKFLFLVRMKISSS